MTVMLEVENVSRCQQAPLDSDFQRWVDAAVAALEQIDKPRTIAIRIVDALESMTLNNSYRQKNKPTNVLSFPSHLPEQLLAQLPEVPLGDLVICAEVVIAEAEQQKKAIANHWAHMVIHGTLHLAGLDHQNDEEAQIMESLETRILATLDIQNPYDIQ